MNMCWSHPFATIVVSQYYNPYMHVIKVKNSIKMCWIFLKFYFFLKMLANFKNL
jgi:hypothetical protein